MNGSNGSKKPVRLGDAHAKLAALGITGSGLEYGSHRPSRPHAGDGGEDAGRVGMAWPMP